MLDCPATPVTTLYQARDFGRRAGLKYVYLGNVNDPGGSDTICPACGQTVIRRRGLQFVDTDLTGNRCNFCGYEIPGVALSEKELS